MADKGKLEGRFDFKQGKGQEELKIADKLTFKGLDRREIQLDLFKSRTLLSDKQIGSLKFKLNELAAKIDSEHKVKFEDLEELDLIVKVREPTKGKYIVRVPRKVLIVDKLPLPYVDENGNLTLKDEA